jgi:hypothetical protein
MTNQSEWCRHNYQMTATRFSDYGRSDWATRMKKSARENASNIASKRVLKGEKPIKSN